ncbi:MAG: GrpB family protein, partial [Bacteroidales bacterium]|nr:GrpB family protein [Bacteroidales bacterium]
KSLWKRFEHDRDGYTNAKTEFVKRHTLAAKKAGNLKCDSEN